MRTIIIFCAMLVLGVVGYLVWDSTRIKHYGESFQSSPSVSSKDLLANPAGFANKPITLFGQVQKQCPVTGCFFYVRDGEKEVKVELGNTVTGLPQKGGHDARIEGQLLENGKEGWVFVGKAIEFDSKAPLPAPAVASSTPAPVTKTEVKTATVDLANYPLKTCVVSGEELGSMGAPFDYQFQNRTIKLCCPSCQKKFDKEPAKYLQKIDAAQIH